MKLFYTLFLFVTMTLMAQAQNGKITGKITEAASGTEIMTANVLVVELGTGAVSDLDGIFSLDLKAGTYTLEISYIGFKTIRLDKVEVVADETKTLNISLTEEGIDMGTEVIVEATEIRNTEAALVTIQKKAPVILDGLSSTQLARTGDRTAAAALQRVSGVTVQGGKYVYVRGLGDRYSKTTLNGSEVPGLDPNRNTLQLDLIPSNIINNILVYKTFSPDLYGDFVGGYVDIETKDFPEQFTCNISLNTSYNTISNLNSNTLTQDAQTGDWLGMGAKARSLATTVSQYSQANFPQYQAGTHVDPNQASALTNVTRAFNNDGAWDLRRAARPLNYGFSAAIGNQTKLFRRPLGWNLGLSYNRQFSSYQNGQYGIYELSGQYNQANSLITQLALRDDFSSDEILWGALLGASYKLSDHDKISINLVHNQSGTTSTRYLIGRKQRDEPNDIFETRTWRYLQRAMSTAQIKGKHEIAKANNLEIQWQSAITRSSQDEPDLRYFTNRYNPDAQVYFIKPSSDRVPSRFYRDMQQLNSSTKIDLSLPVDIAKNISGKVKAGGHYGTQYRQFNEQRYTFAANGINYTGNPSDYFASTNLVTTITDEQGNNTRNSNGIYAINDLDPANSYQASQQVAAFYGMIDFNVGQRLRIITGVRAEQTLTQLLSQSTTVLQRYPNLDGKTNILNNFDLLPSLNINYDLAKDWKLRAAYSRTLARPTFRELAPFASFDVEGGFLIAGNPNLQRSLADNADLRLEFYPNPTDIISASTFYKHFQNPIERTYNPEQPNGEFTFRNVPSAFLAGLEVEARKQLSFIDAPIIRDLSLVANLAYIYSQTKIDATELNQIRASWPDAPATRQMYGQAPYSINTILGYKNETLGLEANLVYNVVGPRLSYVTIGATPNIFEMPRHLLNFNLAKTFAQKYSVRLSANNLLNASYREVITFKTRTYEVQRNALGMTFNLSLNANF